MNLRARPFTLFLLSLASIVNVCAQSERRLRPGIANHLLAHHAAKDVVYSPALVMDHPWFRVSAGPQFSIGNQYLKDFQLNGGRMAGRFYPKARSAQRGWDIYVNGSIDFYRRRYNTWVVQTIYGGKVWNPITGGWDVEYIHSRKEFTYLDRAYSVLFGSGVEWHSKHWNVNLGFGIGGAWSDRTEWPSEHFFRFDTDLFSGARTGQIDLGVSYIF